MRVGVLTFVATLGGLLFGYDTAVISGALSSIEAYFITPQGLPETMASNLSGWMVSSALLGCLVGALLAGWLGTAAGRRGGLLIAALLFLLSSVGSAMPELGLGKIGTLGPAALPAFILYRILGGIGVGLASMLSPLYIAEIAPSAIRGRLVAFYQLAIVAGQLLVYFVNLSIARSGDMAWLNRMGWRWMLISEVIPSGIFLLCLLRVPDTPRWLVQKGREAAALAQLRRLSPEDEAQATLADIRRSLEMRQGRLLSFGPMVIVVGLLMSIFQQFVGINAVIYYAPQMFAHLGASTNLALLQTVVVGAANLIFTLIAIATVDRLGRKPLLIAGALIMALSMLTLGSLFNAQAIGLWALLAVLIFMAGFALSWGPVTWVLLAEIFPNSIKGRAMALAVAAQWLANMLVTWSFKVMDGSSRLNALSHHGFAYWVYGVMGLLAAFFVWRFVPETKGRTLESMEELWTGRSAPAMAGAPSESGPATGA